MTSSTSTNRLPRRWRYLVAEQLDRPGVVAGDDEGGEAVCEHQRQQHLDPLLRWAPFVELKVTSCDGPQGGNFRAQLETALLSSLSV